MKRDQSFRIAVHGTAESARGWIVLLEQEGLPYELFADGAVGSLIHVCAPGFVKEKECLSREFWIVEDALPPDAVLAGYALATWVAAPHIGTFRAPCCWRLSYCRKGELGTIRPWEGEGDAQITFPAAYARADGIYVAGPISSLLCCEGASFRQLDGCLEGQYEYYLSVVDKTEVLRFLKGLLVAAFHAVGLPYFRLAYYPECARSVFLFRQDIDWVPAAGLDHILQLTEDAQIRGTFFVNMSGEEEVEDQIGQGNLRKSITADRISHVRKAGKRHEIANHGYWHQTYGSCAANKRDINRASALLTTLTSALPTGFASPGGSWNPSLERAIVGSGMVYCCCNTLKHGGLPWWDASHTIVHIPTCAAFLPENSVMSAGRQMGSYLVKYAQVQIRLGLPIAVMGHPHLEGETARTIYSGLFAATRREAIPNMTYLEFAEWWKHRGRLSFRVSLTEENVVIEADQTLNISVDGRVHRGAKRYRLSIGKGTHPKRRREAT